MKTRELIQLLKGKVEVKEFKDRSAVYLKWVCDHPQVIWVGAIVEDAPKATITYAEVYYLDANGTPTLCLDDARKPLNTPSEFFAYLGQFCREVLSDTQVKEDS